VPVKRPMLLANAIVEAWRDADYRRRARAANLELVVRSARWEDNMSSALALFDRLCGVEKE